MLKYVTLKKILIKESAIFMGMLLVTAAGVFFAVTKAEELDAEKNTLNINVSNVDGQIQQVRADFTKAKNSLELYQKLSQGKQSLGDSLSRDTAKKILDRLKEEYLLSSLSVTISPAQEIKDIQIQTKTSSLMASDVTLRFEGMSDEQLFSFVSAITREFTGYVRFTRLAMDRTGEITTEILQKAGKGERPALVTGEVSFRWYGLKEQVKPATNPASGVAAVTANNPG